jgi:hypothetical protein
MKCPHCTKEIHFEEYQSWTFQYDNPASEKVTGYEVVYTFCPSCENLIVMMRDGIYHDEKGVHDWITDTCNEELLFPKGIVRPVEQEVPEKYIDDFKEAASVLSISPKASAAISRRLLQHLLRDECKVKKSSLAKEIDEFIAKLGIPTYLAGAIDAVRNVGNFAAHPLKDTNTGEIVEVESGEADWLLDVLEAMFDYLFVQPKRLEKRKKKLNAKLQSIGKPQMK